MRRYIQLKLFYIHQLRSLSSSAWLGSFSDNVEVGATPLERVAHSSFI
jgi:hypothetical protein